MKNLLILFLTTVLFVGCEDVQTNSPAMQGNIDHSFFKAQSTRATIAANGNYLIEGINGDELLSFKILSPNEGNYILGGESGNEGRFTDVNGNKYSTRLNGDGKITVTDWDTSGKTISGIFNFRAMLEGVDTLRVHEGVFFRVPYRSGGGDPIQNAGTFLADIGGEPWEAFTIQAMNTGETIVTSGATASIIILLGLPNDVENGVYQLPSAVFRATYRDDNTVQEAASSGSIEILEHDVVNKTVKGTFFFETASQSITSGQFDITYQ